MSNVENRRKTRFGIIKFLYSSTMFNRRNLPYNAIANELQIDLGIIINEIRTLVSLGHVDNLIPRHATLSQRAMNVMDRIPQPRNYDDFLNMFNNPEGTFGRVGPRVEGYNESFFKKHWKAIIVIISGVAGVATIIMFVDWVSKNLL